MREVQFGDNWYSTSIHHRLCFIISQGFIPQLPSLSEYTIALHLFWQPLDHLISNWLKCSLDGPLKLFVLFENPRLPPPQDIVLRRTLCGNE
jgi:hypothetical protein